MLKGRALKPDPNKLDRRLESRVELSFHNGDDQALEFEETLGASKEGAELKGC